MFKQKYILEVKGKEDRVYRFECDPTAPLGEMHDAIYTMKGVVVEQLQKRQQEEGTETTTATTETTTDTTTDTTTTTTTCTDETTCTTSEVKDEATCAA